MPLTFAGRPVSVTFSIEDYNGQRSTTEVSFPQTATVAEILAQANVLEGIFAALTDGFLVGASINLRGRQTDDPGVGAPTTSQVGRKGVFVFETDAGTTATYEVPSLDRALVTRGSRAIDLEAAAIVAYEGFMTDGVVGITGAPVTGAGIGLARLVRAYERGDDEGRSR